MGILKEEGMKINFKIVKKCRKMIKIAKKEWTSSRIISSVDNKRKVDNSIWVKPKMTSKRVKLLNNFRLLIKLMSKI